MIASLVQQVDPVVINNNIPKQGTSYVTLFLPGIITVLGVILGGWISSRNSRRALETTLANQRKLDEEKDNRQRAADEAKDLRQLAAEQQASERLQSMEKSERQRLRLEEIASRLLDVAKFGAIVITKGEKEEDQERLAIALHDLLMAAWRITDEEVSDALREFAATTPVHKLTSKEGIEKFQGDIVQVQVLVNHRLRVADQVASTGEPTTSRGHR